MGIKLTSGVKQVTITQMTSPVPGITVPYTYPLNVGPNGDFVDWGDGPFMWDEESGTYRRYNPRLIQIGDVWYWVPSWDAYQFNANGTLTYVTGYGHGSFGTFTPCP